MPSRCTSSPSLQRSILTVATVLFVLGAEAAGAAQQFARLHTDAGQILLWLDAELAPGHVANFRHLAAEGFYEGTYFHRVIPGFMIQGGDPNTKDDDPQNDGQGGPTMADVLSPAEIAKVEEVNALLAKKGYKGLGDPQRQQVGLLAEFSDVLHKRGTLSMARAQDPDSGGSQFFICVADTPQLDGQYSVFGRVVLGMDVADAIVNAPRKPGRLNAPVDPVHITKVDLFEGTAGMTEAELVAWGEMQAAGE